MTDHDRTTGLWRESAPQGILTPTAGRFPLDEVQETAARLRGDRLLRALMDWTEGHVLVLNQQRQILLAADDFAHSAGFEDAQGIVGMRLGEVLGCVNATQGPDGCGTSPACQFCGALRAMELAKQTTGPVETEWRLTLKGEQGVETSRHRVRGTGVTVDGIDLIVAHIEHPEIQLMELTGATSSLDLAMASTTSMEGHWPPEMSHLTPIRRLGEGSMGSVYLVEDDDGTPYALKTLRAARAAESQVLQRFEAEVELSMKLHHPHIVRTASFDRTDGGDLYMVSEYCGQGSGSDWLQRMGPLPVDLALYWLTSMSSALAYAWNEHQLIHRDIKPDNLLVDDDGMIKLADFGIALRRSHDRARLTQEGLTMGSVHYMAPEQVQGVEDLDVRADLYSLGATFYKLLAGLPPLDAAEPLAILQRKLGEDAPTIGKYRSSLPEGLVDAIDGLLARDRDKRPQDPETLSRQLMEITAAEGIDLSRVHKHYHLPDVV